MPGLQKLKEEAFVAPSSDFDYPSTFADENMADHGSGFKKIRGSAASRIFGDSGGTAKYSATITANGDESTPSKFLSMTSKKSKIFSPSNGHKNVDSTNGLTVDGSEKSATDLGGSGTASVKSSSLSSNGSSTTGGRLGFRKKAGLNRKCKDDPFRFAGDGVDFKCKLIGFQEVDQARGDQMSQDAIQACKAIVKRKGEHKPRIIFNISLEGLKIKDGATNICLHSFPVSKVSFIAKDVTDSRAFGFVYGASDHEHQFYAIKTEKTADQVVFSIRDMFQIVYEMKKKQVEQAKQQQSQKSQNGHQEVIKCKTGDDVSTSTPDENVPEANLLDLETELEHLEQGMHVMDQWVPPLADWPLSAGGDFSFLGAGDSTSSSATTWATASLSSSALTELNAAVGGSDPLAAEHIFTSSTNSFGSSTGYGFRESFVPPPPSVPGAQSRRPSQLSHAYSSTNGHSTLFGPPPSSVGLCPMAGPFDEGVADDPFNTSHVTSILSTKSNGFPPVAPCFGEKISVGANDANWPNAPISSTAVPSFGGAQGPPNADWSNVTPPSKPTTTAPSSDQNDDVSFLNSFFTDTPRVSSTPVALSLGGGLSHDRRRPPVTAPFAEGCVGGNVGDSRMPSVITSTTTGVPPVPHSFSFSGVTADDFSSPDRSVFSAANLTSSCKASNVPQPASNFTIFNNAMNDTHLFRSFMGADAPTGGSSSIDWSSTSSPTVAPHPNFLSSNSPANPIGQSSRLPAVQSTNHAPTFGSSPSLTGEPFCLPPLANQNNASHAHHGAVSTHGLPISQPPVNHNASYSPSSTNGFLLHHPPTSNRSATYGAAVPREDPFAQWRQKPVKKTINQLRDEQLAGQEFLSQLESFETFRCTANGSGHGSAKCADVSSHTEPSQNHQKTANIARPSLPPRLPPPSSSSNLAAKNFVSASGPLARLRQKNDDPFADDFFN